MPETAVFVPREVRSAPTTARVQHCLDRYLSEPLYVDCEYVSAYTRRHREVASWEEQERRAECHADGLEHMTPVIREGELIAGSKTRYVRGAIPYVNYAADYVLRELRREQQEAQDSVTDLGTGGGIERGRRQADEGTHEVFCHRFLITPTERQDLWDLASYWSGRCMQSEGDPPLEDALPARAMDRGRMAHGPLHRPPTIPPPRDASCSTSRPSSSRAWRPS